MANIPPLHRVPKNSRPGHRAGAGGKMARPWSWAWAPI